MKRSVIAIVWLLSHLALMAGVMDAQPPDGPGAGRQNRPAPPIFTALDANQDGTIGADEIANAAVALKTLDKNSDGQLTRDEYVPQRPGGLGGSGGQGGPGGLGSTSRQGGSQGSDDSRGQGGPGGPGSASRQGGSQGSDDSRGPGGEGQKRPKPPIDTALDANQDGVIGADEIANAPVALKALDKDADGQLSRDECLPPRPAQPTGGQDRE